MTMEVGLVLPAGPAKGQINKWLDDLDVYLPRFKGHIRSLWMTDHLFWEDTPTYESWTVLAFIAARWTEFELGPVVLGQSYRNPALLAKMAATLQTLTRGKLIMGVGAGWKQDEYRAYGYPFPDPATRVEQLEDTLEIMTRLWTQQDKVTYYGKHYHIVDAYCEPKPAPIPPILVGGGGRKTMLLAARYAQLWNMPDAMFDDFNRHLKVLEHHCESIERDFSTLRKSWFGRLGVGKTEAAAKALSNNQWTRDNAFVGTTQQIIQQLEPFSNAGVDYYMFEILGLPDPDVIDMVLEDILPALLR